MSFSNPRGPFFSGARRGLNLKALLGRPMFVRVVRFAKSSVVFEIDTTESGHRALYKTGASKEGRNVEFVNLIKWYSVQKR